MGNLFDGMQNSAFDVVTATMGKTATWIPSNGGQTPQNSQVLFNNPDSMRKLGDVEYLPTNTVIEFRNPFFPSLKTNVDQGLSENISIEGDTYYVRSVKKMWDGNTFVAVLEKNN